MRIAMIGPFGLGPKGTMRMRALPMAQALTARGYEVEMFLPPWNNPEDSGREEERGGVKIHNITLPPSIPLLGHLIITWRLLSRALDETAGAIKAEDHPEWASSRDVARWVSDLRKRERA